jgi:hypothetical protein
MRRKPPDAREHKVLIQLPQRAPVRRLSRCHLASIRTKLMSFPGLIETNDEKSSAA